MTGKDSREATAANKFFGISMESRTRGHGYKLFKNKLEPRGIEFSV